MPVTVRCGDPAFDDLPVAAEEWLRASLLCVALDGSGLTRTHLPGAGDSVVRGYSNTSAPLIDLNDHAQALWGGAFFEADCSSATDAQLRAPRPDGSLFDTLRPLPSADQPLWDSFDDRLRNIRWEREPLQTQSESWAVLAAHRAWQMSGDKHALLSRLPVLERAIEYSFHHPQRWSSELELPKRAFTLDSWPIEFGRESNAPSSTRLAFDGSTKWCVHAGDACRLFGACRALSQLFGAVGQVSDQERWRERATHLEAQLNSVGWNGSFYSHQIHLDAVRLRGVDEARQLAACNASAMNSGLASQEQCASILREYMRRRELNLETSFCEWWSIQPPFPMESFGVAPAQSANGGVWPVIGGELARAALTHGQESYGVETLRRFGDLSVKSRRVWPWYDVEGAPGRSIEYSNRTFATTSHDPAAASAFLRALVEGLCGVRDEEALFSSITLAPRWPATGQATAEVEVSYAGNPAYVSYRWALDGGRMTLDYESKAKHVAFDLLLPRGNLPERVALNGRTHEYALVPVEKSKYVRFETDKKRGAVAITLK